MYQFHEIILSEEELIEKGYVREERKSIFSNFLKLTFQEV